MAYLGATPELVGPAGLDSTVPGPAGAAGTAGAAGAGVAVGGTVNQVLAKTSGADYATAWVTPAAGGAAASGLEATFLLMGA